MHIYSGFCFQIKYFPALQNNVILIHVGAIQASLTVFTPEQGCTYLSDTVNLNLEAMKV